MAHHVVACQQIPEQVLGAVQPVQLLLQLLQVGDDNLVPLRQRLPLSQPKLNHPALQNTLLGQNLHLSDPASNSCHSCSSPSPEETSLPGNLEAFLGTRFRGPLGFRFLLCRGPRASAAALTAICCSLICLANRIKSSFWKVSVLDTSNLCKCLTLSTLQTDTDHSSETRASCTHKLTSVFHSGPNVLLCKSNVNGGRLFLGLSSSSSSRIMSSMLFNIRRNRFWNDLPTFNQIFTDHHMNFNRTSNDPRMHDKRTIRPKKKRPPFKWQSNKSQN